MVVIFLMFGGLFSSVISKAFGMNETTFLMAHFCIIIANILHWLTNGNRCFLTDLEYDGSTSSEFMISILNIFGIELSDECINILSYNLLILLAVYSFNKLKRLQQN
jgi:hypothetical protein